MDFVLVCQETGDIIFIISIMDLCVFMSSSQIVLLPVVVPVSVLVCTESKHTNLITYVDSKHYAEETSGRISSMTFKPRVEDIFDKCWIINQHLIFVSFYSGLDRHICLCNSARAQGTNKPLQIQSLERDQHQSGGVVQVCGAFWIHYMMSCPPAHILLKASGGSLIHSYDEIVGVDPEAVPGTFEISRVTHHSTGSAAFGAGIHVKRLTRDEPKQLLLHFIEVGRLGL